MTAPCEKCSKDYEIAMEKCPFCGYPKSNYALLEEAKSFRALRAKRLAKKK